jgi:methionine--tRNA ligase
MLTHSLTHPPCAAHARVRRHAYTSTVADVYARAARSSGREVFFLTGTDEHGLKVEQSAAARGVAPQALADENSAAFRAVMTALNISFDHFIRTTDDAHVRQVSALVQRLCDSGDAYLGTFEGWYDAGQEEYYAEQKAKDLEYKSPINGKPLVRATEENYYFRLSAYSERLLALFEARPDFVRPPARRNEMLARLRDGLSDVPISRTNFSWGIPFLSDERHVIYVWIDALLNYATALGLGEAEGHPTREARAHFWPAQLHVMAKEIAWFHAVIWPAMLMALNLPLPATVYAHGFWIRDGMKMSKSLGNFVDLASMQRYINAYGLDSFRYYLIVDGPLGATDANFSAERLQDVYSAELVNTLGNSASRVTAMIGKYFDGVVPTELDAASGARIVTALGGGVDWPARAAAAAATAADAYESLDLATAARAGVRLVTDVDVFIQATEPFKIAKDETRMAELGAILYQCLEALRIAGVLLAPVLPVKMAELNLALCGADVAAAAAADALPTAQRVAWGGLRVGTRVEKLALFPRVESPDAAEIAAAAAAAAPVVAKKGAKLPKKDKAAVPPPAASS